MRTLCVSPMEDSKTSQLVMNVLKAHVRERGLGLPEDSSNVGMWWCWDFEMAWEGIFLEGITLSHKSIDDKLMIHPETVRSET